MCFENASFPGKISEFLPENVSVFVIASARLEDHVQRLREMLGENVIHFSRVKPQVPLTLVDEAEKECSASSATVLLAIGGGSAIGLAKALALRTRLPILAVPTTYAGSEMTNIWGISGPDGKETGRDVLVLPRWVLYDPLLTQQLPLDIARKSAMNAMAHLIEAVYAQPNNPMTYHLALEGIKRLRKGLLLLAKAKNLTAEINVHFLQAAWLAGKCLGEVSMALHHKTAHILGGSLGLDHASVHTALQPFAFAYQWSGLSQKIRQDFQQVFDHTFPPTALLGLIRDIGAPRSLQEIGYKETAISPTVEKILARPYPNPVPLEREKLAQMLRQALIGQLIGGDHI
ncbi:MAG: iron-containing alcohol dehydrogenase [Bacteroidota bacterium]